MKQIKLPNIVKYVPWLCVLILALLSLYFLLICNGDVLFMHQLRSLFNDTSEFYRQYQAMPAGFLHWAGCYFTQLFYYPAVGSLALFVMWTATFFLMKKALRVPDALTPLLLIPAVCLLASEIDLGYWIYYHKNGGYCFSQTLGMLTAAALVFVCRYATAIKVKFGDIIVGVVSTVAMVLLYPFIGIYALAASATMGMIMLQERKWISSALYVASAVVAPFLFKDSFDALYNGHIFTAGLPVFEVGDIVNSSLTTPFKIAIISFIAFALVSRLDSKVKTEKAAKTVSYLLLVVVTACSGLALNNADYKDENYHAECKAYRAIDEQRWNDALNIIHDVEGPLTRQLIMLKNVALCNTHEIGNHMYDFNERDAVRPMPDDSLKVSMVNTSAPIIYLHHGMTNYAYHWCMENQVEKGFDIAHLKIMVLACIVNGEGKIAEKYLKILSHTTFYKDWAEHYMPVARDPKLISKYPELANISDLHSHIDNRIDSDEGICENYIRHYFSNTFYKDSKYFQEMNLIYCIITRSIPKFWTQFITYVQLHKGETIPEIYQQAACMYADLEPQTAPDLKAYGIQLDKARILDRYEQFDKATQDLVRIGMSEEAVAQQTKAEFGNTFWWAYYFVKGAKCY